MLGLHDLAKELLGTTPQEMHLASSAAALITWRFCATGNPSPFADAPALESTLALELRSFSRCKVKPQLWVHVQDAEDRDYRPRLFCIDNFDASPAVPSSWCWTLQLGPPLNCLDPGSNRYRNRVFPRKHRGELSMGWFCKTM